MRKAGRRVKAQRLGVFFARLTQPFQPSPKSWELYGLKPWIEAAERRLHHNVLAIALANRLARIAWAVLNKERNFECVKTREAPMTRSVAGPTTAIRNATLRTTSSDRNTDRLRHRREGASRPNGGSDAHRHSKLAGHLRHRQRDRNSS